MTANILQGPGFYDARRAAFRGLLVVAVGVFGACIIALLSGAHPWWWAWVIAAVAALGAALASGSGMALYILRRMVWAIVVINIVVAITFLVFFKLPNGDPALRFAGKEPSPANLALIRHRLHLDKPWYVEYFYFEKNF